MGAEFNYSPIEKTCLTLISARKNLRHYMLAHTVHLISRVDPLKYIITRPVLSRRLAKWALLLLEFDIIYVPQKAVKGHALADFLADHPIPVDWELSEDLPDEDVFYINILPAWMMFFDGTTRKDGTGASFVFVSPQREILTYSFVLTELCSNNMAEYQALIIGLEMTIDLEIHFLTVYGDLKLVINQLKTKYEVHKDDLVPYHHYAIQLLMELKHATIEHVPRSENEQADALANLASVLALTGDEATTIPVCAKWVIPPKPSQEETEHESNVVFVFTMEVEDWRRPFIDYLQHGKLPKDPKCRAEIRR
ncbi:PREDICTED: uncharacterized protein LOC104602077 [Nelumbo nucifera]|uniref:Uncharacterized protein LOC104602077 n=1 Tax=Nelumbo nucifera TaxID=4432 RepID=A0A1U8AEH3_NELNU|nr:PREDICTED: uncharacterized protein LOC104602077 [Nelumbo nucifera]